jgi:peptidoglycan/LPS O-acetylase OafA/YrhL
LGAGAWGNLGGHSRAHAYTWKGERIAAVLAAKPMKKHYEALDGLRGVAAVSVLLFHLGHWLNAPWLATNSHLAVDLFFCLSGFVLPVAYWKRRDTLSLLSFIRIRAIRLMPLIMLGAVVSAAYVVLKVRTEHLPVPASAIALAAFGSLFNIPTFGAPHDIGGPMVFPLNGPQFTLFLEFVVNIAWWALRRAPQMLPIGATVVACAMLMAVLGIGGDTERSFLLGFPRVGLSFALGLMLYHLRERLAPSRAVTGALFVASGLATLALFFMPVRAPPWLALGWIVVVSPLLVLSGARLKLRRSWADAALLLGALSYPVYALHYPIFCWVNGLYRARFGAQDLLVEAPLVVAVVLLGAYGALSGYDEPMRRALSRRPGATTQRIAAE